MVEGLDARSLFRTQRMNNLIEPGLILLFIGLFLPLLIVEYNNITGRFTITELNLFNSVFSVIMATGLALLAYGVTYRRKGHIIVPIVLCILLLCSVDLFIWIYFVWLNWLPGPADIFILPFAPPGDIPLLLTLLFIILILMARLSYFRDPRRSGRPKYSR